MNKKELAGLRKEFKSDTFKLNINELYNVYLKKDNGVVVHQELHYFEKLDEEMKELYLKNFKKVLTGAFDTKLFELEFQAADNENSTQSILYNMNNSVDGENLIEGANKLIEKLIQSYNYDSDVVVTIIKAEYMMNFSKKGSEYDEGADDVVQGFKFLLCSINKIDIPKRALRFDFKQMEFNINSLNDTVINLNAPVGGFMFPVISCGEANVNRVLFYNGKSKVLDGSFIEGVLNCSLKMDAVTERETFSTILQNAIGDTIKPEMMQDIYERINEVAATCDEESGEVPVVNIEHVKGILEDIGVGSTSELELAFETHVGQKYDFKVQNILPDFNSKSIKITSDSANIMLTPKDLSSIRQVKDKNGRKCLLIELTEDVVIDGFKLETIDEEI
ncbi:MAG: hypothetical protein K0R09_2369 [Clostridiales bacterium]|jgi:hypothetical protein|nr:hypothetical protein [Clostridiales bacterium]